MHTSDSIEMPLVKKLSDFDVNSGSWLERMVFNHRLVIILICLVVTLGLGFRATQLQVNASFERMIPHSHPYTQTFFKYAAALGMGTSVRIAVENENGTIFDKDFLLVAQKVTDTATLMPGVSRGWVRGLWTPSLRWSAITREGFVGGPVMPDDWNGSPESMQKLGANIARAGIIGSYVSPNLKSTSIVVPLLEKDPLTGKELDYGDFSRLLEGRIRSLGTASIKIHITGFAKVVGDLIEGLQKVAVFFAVSATIAGLIVFLYIRCLRSTLLLLSAAATGVIWLLGLLQIFGYVLDPFSILVPFLIFAIGLSHGAQKINGITQDIGRGMPPYVAARYTFRRLFLPGLTALLTNVFGFAVLLIIDIPIIKDMALATSMGVGVLIFTKLILVPCLFSYIGISPSAARRSLEQIERRDNIRGGVWEFLTKFTRRREATITVVLAAMIAIAGIVVSTKLQYGDLDRGEPLLRADSRYNRDEAFVNQNYGTSSDQFVLIGKVNPGDCFTYPALVEADRLGQALREVPGVTGISSAAESVRLYASGLAEGNPKWISVPRSPANALSAMTYVRSEHPELGENGCELLPVIASLTDHRAETLERVVHAAEAFTAAHDTPDRKFLLAAGNGGIEAATNEVVKDANHKILALLYLSVIVLCWITFRSWRAVVVALVPLIITSILCEALMVVLGMGVKVATLPVIALGVGAGVDYALYLISVQLKAQRSGRTLEDSYREALNFTGRVVGLVGFTLAVGVIVWAWSPIKFQADMGILLTFMFVWNMVGALILIPALSHFLLPDPPITQSAGSVGAHWAEASSYKPASSPAK